MEKKMVYNCINWGYSEDETLDYMISKFGNDDIEYIAELITETYEKYRSNVFEAYAIHGFN